MKLLLTLAFTAVCSISLFANSTLIKETTDFDEGYFGYPYQNMDIYKTPLPKNKSGFPDGTIVYVAEGEAYKIDGTADSGRILRRYSNIYVYEYIGEYMVFYGTWSGRRNIKRTGLFLTDGTTEGTIRVATYTYNDEGAIGDTSFIVDNFITAPGNILYYWGESKNNVTGERTYQLWKYTVSINVPEENQIDIEEDDVRVAGDTAIILHKVTFPEITFSPENSKLSIAIAGMTLTCDAEELWKSKKNGVYSYQSKGSKEDPTIKLTIDTNKKEWSLNLKKPGLLKNVDLDKKLAIKLIIDDVAYGNAVQIKKKR